MPAAPQPASPSALVGVMTVVLTLVGWSSVPLFLRHFADSIDPWTSNGWRYGFSALVWLPVVVVGLARGLLPRGLWRAAIIPSIVNALGQVCFTVAHYRIDPAMLTFGLRCQLLFVAVGAWMLFPRERAIIRTPGYLIGAALLIGGMIAVLLLGAPSSSPLPLREGADAISPLPQGEGLGVRATIAPSRHTHAAHVEGVLLAIGSGLLFAAYGLSVRKFMHGVNSVLAFSAICQYTAIVMVALMLFNGEQAGMTAWNLSAGEFSWLLVSALIGIAIGHVFYYLSIARLGIAVTAGVLQLQPFLVAIGSFMLFGEVLSGGQWAGGVAAAVGAFLMLGVQYWRSREAAGNDDVERRATPVRS